MSGIDAYPSKHALTEHDWSFTNRYNLAPPFRIIGNIIDDRLNRLRPEEKLVIISGEEHSTPAHLLIQTGIMAHLASRREKSPADATENFVMAYEQPFNNLSLMANTAYKLKVQTHLKYKMQEYDREGHLALKANLINNTYKDAPLSRERVFRAALGYNIPVIFNDAAYIPRLFGGAFLDFKDDLLHETLKKAGKSHNLRSSYRTPRIDIGSPLGLALRNSLMVERALVFARKQHARIIIQQCGAGHIFGNREKGWEYADSLVSRFREAGYRTMAIFVSSEKSGHTPEKIVDPRVWDHEPESVILRGLHGRRYYDENPSKENLCLTRFINSFDKGNKEHCPFNVPLLKPDRHKEKAVIDNLLNENEERRIGCDTHPQTEPYSFGLAA